MQQGPLELLHSSNSKTSQFQWDIVRGNEIVNNVSTTEKTTDVPKYTYTFTEPGVYDISVTSISGDKWLSHANKRLIVGIDCRLSTSTIPEIAITAGTLKWGEATTFTLQNNHIDSDILGFEDTSWKVIKNSSERKAVDGSFPSSNIGGEVSETGQSITIDLPAKSTNSDIIHSMNVYLSTTATAEDDTQGSVSCSTIATTNSDGTTTTANSNVSCSSEQEAEILSCKSYRSKGFNLAEFTDSSGNEMTEGSGPYFVSVQPYIWTKQEIMRPAICRLPQGCDFSDSTTDCDCLPFPPTPPTFTLEPLTLESHDIYRYSRKRVYSYTTTTTTISVSATTTSSSTSTSILSSSSSVTTTTQTNSQPREHLAFFNAHVVGASNCSYNISYSHKTDEEQGTFNCSAISDISHTIEEPPDNYTPEGGGWIPFTVDATQDCQEATITITADGKKETYYNYCPQFDLYGFTPGTLLTLSGYYYTHNCYFGPVAQRPERHSCDFEHPSPQTIITTTTHKNSVILEESEAAL